MTCFDAPTISSEDRQRTQLYATERARETLKCQVGSLEEWLKTLALTVNFELLSRALLPRAAQLLNKTNQLNLSTRRLTEPEFWGGRAPPPRLDGAGGGRTVSATRGSPACSVWNARGGACGLSISC